MDIKLDIQTNVLQNLFNKLKRNTADLTKVWVKFLPEYRDTIKKNYGNKGLTFQGERWTKLNERYRKYKMKKVGNKPLMVWSGALKSAAFGESQDGFSEITSKSLTVGIKNILYAEKHQTGDYGLPQRAYIYRADKPDELIRTDWTKLLRIIESHIEEADK
jgi:hypothetical protein